MPHYPRMTDDEPVDPELPPEDSDGRRTRWSRWVAIAVLVTFGMFVLWNVVTVLVLVLTNATRNGSGPFGP